MTTKEELLHMMEENARMPEGQMALMLGKEVGEIRQMIEEMEAEKIIRGYRTLVDWDKTGVETVNALIEVKITPQRDRGFDRVAEKIYNYPEVDTLYLMSGGFDFAVMLTGKTMKEVAYFVAMKLAPIEAVTSTSTHFILRKYKEKGVLYGTEETDERITF